MSSKRVPRFARFCNLLVYFIFLVVCVEVGLQGFYYVTAGDLLFRRVALPIYAGESWADYGNRPGLSFAHRTNEFHAHYYVNKAGFRVPVRDVEYSKRKPSDTYRIMLLGPSFAFGWGVDYELSFARVLQRLLEQRKFAGDMKIELINAGIPAMPLAPQLRWFEMVGRDYEPDLVIQLVYGSMAISNTSPDQAVDGDGYLVSNSGGRVRWRERLKKLATVFYGWWLWTTLDNINSSSQLERKGNAVQGAGREMYERAQFDPTEREVRESMAVYSRLQRATRAAGARLLVVFFPLSYAIHREDESRWRHLGIRDVGLEAAFDTAFVRYLNENHIPSIDITQQLRRSADAGERLYFWLDIHWTPMGNATAAQAVANSLTAH